MEERTRQLEPQAPCLFGRNRTEHKNDPPLRALAKLAAVSGQAASRTLAHQHLYRGIAPQQARSTMDARGGDERTGVLDLSERGSRTHSWRGRCRYLRQLEQSQDCRRRGSNPEDRRQPSLPAPIQPRPKPYRDGLLKTQGTDKKATCTLLPRPFQSPRRGFKIFPQRTLHGLLSSC